MKTITLIQNVTFKCKKLIAIACLSLLSVNAHAYEVSINGSEYLTLETFTDQSGNPTYLEYDYDATPSTTSFMVVDPIVCSSKGNSSTPSIVAQISNSNGDSANSTIAAAGFTENNINFTQYDFENDQVNITTDNTVSCATQSDADNNVILPPAADLLFENGFESGFIVTDDIQLSLLKVVDSNMVPMVTEPFPITPIAVSNNQEVEYQYTIVNNSASGGTRTVNFVEFYNLDVANGPVFNDLQNWSCSTSSTIGGTSCGSNSTGNGPVKLENAQIAPGERLIIYVDKESAVSAVDISGNKKLKMLASVFVTDNGNVDSNPANNTTYQEFGSTLVTATQLVITSQPVSAVAGATIGTFELQFQDAGGQIDGTNSSSVTVSFQNNPSNGLMAGTITKAAINGVVSFDNLSIDLAGVGYTLNASGGSFTSPTSNAISIIAATASQLAVVTQPMDTVAGGIINPVSVQLQDTYGNLVNSNTGGVHVSIVPFAGASGAILSGSNDLIMSNGVVSFNDLSINLVNVVNDKYRLRFNYQFFGGNFDSGEFDITAIPVAANSEFGVNTNSETAGMDVTYSAIIRDATNTPVGAGIIVNFSMANTSANTPTVTCTTNASGTCSVDATSTLIGSTVVSADINGNNIVSVTSGLFNSTTWQAGAPDAAMSNFWVSTATSTTGSSVSVLAEVKDQYGNVVSGVPVTFSLTDASGAVTPDFPSCSSTTSILGICSASVTSASTGTTTVTSAAAGFPSVLITNPIAPVGFGRVITWQ